LSGRISYRTIAPIKSATQIGYSGSVQVSSFSGGEPTYGSVVSSPTMPTSTSTEYRFNGVYAVNSSNSDIAIQSAFGFSSLTSNPINVWSIISQNSGITGTGIFIKTTINLNHSGVLDGKIERISSGTVTESINFRINENLLSKLANGFLLEMYIQQIGNGELIIKSYATLMPTATPVASVRFSHESIYLGAFACNGWGSDIYAGNLYGATGFNLGGSTGTLYDATIGVGNFNLDVDLGNCNNEDYTPQSFPSTITDSNSWGIMLNNWRGDGWLGSGSPLSNGIQLNNQEIVANNSTFSKKFEVDISTYVSGSFYVAISNRVPNDEVPEAPIETGVRLIDRINIVKGGTGLSDTPPTVAIVFDDITNSVYIQQVLSTGYVRKDTIAPFQSQSTGETWKITFDFLDYQESAPQMKIILKRKDIPIYGGSSVVEQEGYEYVGDFIDPITSGLGYYVAVGSMSNVIVSNVSIQGIPQLNGGNDLSSLDCQFTQGQHSHQDFKSLLGQSSYSCLNDENDFIFTNPIDSNNPFNWSNLTLYSVSASDPSVTTADIGKKYYISGTKKVRVVNSTGTGLVDFSVPINVNYYARFSNYNPLKSYRIYQDPTLLEVLLVEIEDFRVGTLPILCADNGPLSLIVPSAGDPHPYVAITDINPGEHSGETVLINDPSSPNGGIYTLTYKTTNQYYVNRVYNVNAKVAFTIDDVTASLLYNGSYWIGGPSTVGLSDGDIMVLLSITTPGWSANSVGGLTYANYYLIPGIYAYSSAGSPGNTSLKFKQLERMYVESATSADNALLFDVNNKIYLEHATDSTFNTNIESSNALIANSACLLYGGTVNVNWRGVYVILPTKDFASLNTAELAPITFSEDIFSEENERNSYLVNAAGNYYVTTMEEDYYSKYVASTLTPTFRIPKVFTDYSSKKITVVDLAATEPINPMHVDVIDGVNVSKGMTVFDPHTNTIYVVQGIDGAYSLSPDYGLDQSVIGNTITVNCRILNASTNISGFKNNLSVWYFNGNKYTRSGQVLCQKIKMNKSYISTSLNSNISLLEFKEVS
jgi:hypothetical protein